MSYCIQTGNTPGDIMPQRMSEAQLLKIATTTDVVGDIDQDMIDRAIVDADALINGYCATKYSVPFNPVPARVKTGSARLATFFLFDQAASRIGMPESVRNAYEDEVAFFKDVAKGIASLGVTPAPTTSTSSTVVANERKFTDETMLGF